MQKKVAIFDIDGTIFRSSLLIELVNILIERKVFPESSRKDFEREYADWINRKGSYADYIKAVVSVFMKNIKGIGEEEFSATADEVVRRQENHIYRYTRDLISKLKAEGYYLLAISNSPKMVTDIFCRRHGFDKNYGTIYELDETKQFTGKIVDYDLIMNKNLILRRSLEKENLTLENSIGVGDTENDISFLEMVASPICFNPNQALYDHALKSSWKVVVERKDVIYEL